LIIAVKTLEQSDAGAQDRLQRLQLHETQEPTDLPTNRMRYMNVWSIDVKVQVVGLSSQPGSELTDVR
jgi:hypothetical protein